MYFSKPKTQHIRKRVLLASVLFFVITGCGSSTPAPQTKPISDNSNNQVKSVIESQISQSAQTTPVSDATQQKNDALEKYPANTLEIRLGDNDKDVDIDVSGMNADMTYAVVFDMVNNPDKYIGKTICIKGTSASMFFEPTGITYHTVMITDALACCQNGMEYKCGDDNYVADGSEVYVTGTFNTYTETIDNITTYYVRLENSKYLSA